VPRLLELSILFVVLSDRFEFPRFSNNYFRHRLVSEGMKGGSEAAGDFMFSFWGALFVFDVVVKGKGSISCGARFC
jgi:hypothetical protein